MTRKGNDQRDVKYTPTPGYIYCVGVFAKDHILPDKDTKVITQQWSDHMNNNGNNSSKVQINLNDQQSFPPLKKLSSNPTNSVSGADTVKDGNKNVKSDAHAVKNNGKNSSEGKVDSNDQSSPPTSTNTKHTEQDRNPDTKNSRSDRTSSVSSASNVTKKNNGSQLSLDAKSGCRRNKRA
jgi:hypothetical protein